MSATTEKVTGIRILAPLTWVAIGAVLVAAAAMILGRMLPVSGANVSDTAAVAQEIVLNASAAAAGDNAAYDALDSSRKKFAAALAGDSQFSQRNPSAQKLLTAAQVVLDGREATVSAHAAARNAATVVPQLLQSFGNIASGFGAARVATMTQHLERFEQTGERLKRNLEALADGVGEAERTAKSASENLEYIGQVAGELGGEDSGLGLPRVTGADGEKKLAAFTALYRNLATHARATISSAAKVGAVQQARAEAV